MKFPGLLTPGKDLEIFCTR